MKNNGQRQYFSLYHELRQPEHSGEEAYLATEQAWVELYGAGKYSSYNSFRSMLSRYCKRVRRV